MPIYEYLCTGEDCHNTVERTCRVADWTPEIPCPICGAEMRHQLPKVAVHDDHPRWLTPNVVNQIQGDDDVAPIETRGEYEAHCKKHNIVVTDKRI